MKIIQNSRKYSFKPSFLDKMTGIQLQSWIEAAEQILRDNKITYEKTVENGHIVFQLDTEEDYREVCNLSMDIGTRALSIEALYMTDHCRSLETVQVAGNA